MLRQCQRYYASSRDSEEARVVFTRYCALAFLLSLLGRVGHPGSFKEPQMMTRGQYIHATSPFPCVSGIRLLLSRQQHFHGIRPTFYPQPISDS